ncbi:nephrocystin-1-like [Corticium candelabrum]|uniref:nephrocystin-1-like n=1 Tax=Corticium candelabrum TaxID=121492 RepID=UPI002E253EF5|nr:nephrocystin-1-like [Corticium candelabrum]
MSRRNQQSPIAQVRIDVDELVNKVERLSTEYEEFLVTAPTLDTNAEKEKGIRRRCVQYDQMVNEKLQQVYRLTQDSEPVPLADFNDRKKQEIRKLNRMQKVINEVSSKLHRDAVEQSYFQEHKMQKQTAGATVVATQVEDGDDDDDDDDDEDDDDDDDDDDGDDGDNDDDGNEDNSIVEEGSVFEEQSSEEDDEGTPAFQKADIDSTIGDTEFTQAKCLADFVGEEDDDLSFRKGECVYIIDRGREDGWWVAENSDGQQGLVPSNYLKVVERQQEISVAPIAGNRSGHSLSPRGRELWDKVKSIIKQPSLADVLLGMGAIPSGFRSSTLAKLVHEHEGTSACTSSWLVPKLSESHLSFRDLHWDFAASKLRSRPVAVTRGISILGASNIPNVTQGLTILSRHIRVALFNKQEVLSNVHTVRAVWIEKEPKTWKFQPKVQQGFASTAYDADCVVRFNNMSTDSTILFELCFTYRQQKTDEEGELSCGWATLPLFEADGKPVISKTRELKVNGGTPYESGIEVDPALTTKPSGKRFTSLLRTSRTPRLFVKLQYLRRNVIDVCNMLPDVLITSVNYIPFISYYRQVMADELLLDRTDEQDASPICSPVLSVFSQAIDQPDIMDVLRERWSEELKVLRRSFKKNTARLKEMFKRILLETVYPLVSSPHLPPSVWGDDKLEEERYAFIQSVKSRTALEWFSDSELCHKPLNASELAFTVLSDFCIT